MACGSFCILCQFWIIPKLAEMARGSLYRTESAFCANFGLVAEMACGSLYRTESPFCAIFGL